MKKEMHKACRNAANTNRQKKNGIVFVLLLPVQV